MDGEHGVGTIRTAHVSSRLEDVEPDSRCSPASHGDAPYALFVDTPIKTPGPHLDQLLEVVHTVEVEA